MKKQILLIGVAVLLLSSSSLYSQHKVKLDKNIKLDTLRIWINYPHDFDNVMITKFDSIFTSTLIQFNKSASFFVTKDSLNPDNRIIINMDPIKYIDIKLNLLATAINLVMIGGQVYFICSSGTVFPFFSILFPETNSRLNITIDQKITSKPKMKTTMGSNAYFMKKEKQSRKFEEEFGAYINKFLRKIDKQNIKNNKP